MSEMSERVELVLHDFLQGEMTIPEAARAAIEAHKAALAEAGFVIVPREPTEAMADAGAVVEFEGQEVGLMLAPWAWRAMVDAAPVSERGTEE